MTPNEYVEGLKVERGDNYARLIVCGARNRLFVRMLNQLEMPDLDAESKKLLMYTACSCLSENTTALHLALGLSVLDASAVTGHMDELFDLMVEDARQIRSLLAAEPAGHS